MDDVEAAAMLSSIPNSGILASGPLPEDDTVTESRRPESRSSSLSELGDVSDDQYAPTPVAPAAAELTENDSEAETERLDNTPRRPQRTATAMSLASEQLYERTPSKLVHSIAADEDESAPASPTRTLQDSVNPASGSAALDALSFLAANEAVNLELAGKKRKRPSVEEDALDRPVTEPARKRSSTEKGLSLNGARADIEENAEDVDMEEELDQAEERLSVLNEEGAELETRQAEVASETVNELATVAKLAKVRKGRGRGKRKADNAVTVEAVMAEAHNGLGDADNDDEESPSLDEECKHRIAPDRKAAIDGLARIERKFKIFREKMCDEQLAQCERELEALKQPKCNHPEYLAAIQCVDERMTNKVAYEKQLMKHKLDCLDRQTIAQRHQLHSQYFQTVRDVREKILAECNRHMFDLRRGTRHFGRDEVEYGIRIPEKRSDQIRQQAAYNLEVSILSGIAKYVGFPAAPDVRPARQSEIDDDLRAMKITTRPPPQPVPHLRSYTRNTTADEVAAEEQFIEKTPWANPHHPAHQHQHYGAAMVAARPPNHQYQTPAGQRRMVDIHAPNGSASTIDALSNPPSSANAPPAQINGRMGESISPVLQMRRNPSDHMPYNETPGSMPRQFAGMTRDPYSGNAHVLSSPAGGMRPEEHQGPRWTPINGAPPMPPDARQGPLTQRNGIGPVNVGSNAGLFGR
ncbi:hypothetical protein M011DRAFT_396191 [Sporormia fimetaria CBS 119925]|uniref:Transcriptional regulatory protein DEP1 n=1 Tax=Sporormia fimetaria CBS 119925 TaxID=1340428 RepID=A0A6A6VJQ6_9PLEO|nr:hypothetical protein M011DRAFT_396191 [Sporormia fimetaria CBS 119925]